MNSPEIPSPVRTEVMRDEVSWLGEMLGETIREIAGDDAFLSVEKMRWLAWQRRNGDPAAEQQMIDFIHSLDDRLLQVTIRAFTIFLDLLNLAEDRQRIRTLEQRAEAAYPASRHESVSAAIEELYALGKTPDEMQRLLDQIQIELVFTAHPTDAKRQSVRQKLTQLRKLLHESEQANGTLRERKLHRLMRSELMKLWQTDFIRPWRPSVMQEVRRGLSIKPVLWQEVPKILMELKEAVDKHYLDDVAVRRPVFRFGSWIGGDRDGHPGVTAEITQQTLVWLRESAIEFHLDACSELFRSLSLSERQSHFSQNLKEAIEQRKAQWPLLEGKLAELHPGEYCRQWLAIMQWRLQRTLQIVLEGAPVDGAYGNGEALASDIRLLLDAILVMPGGASLAEEVHAWLIRTEIFGLHLAQLDVRQDARVYRTVINELMEQVQIAESAEQLTEHVRQQVLIDSMNVKLNFDRSRLSAMAQETLDLFRVLYAASLAYGPAAIGGHVISMTAKPSDVLSVLWLWKQTLHQVPSQSAENAFSLPIVPLFETIEDLHNAPRILNGMLSIPVYRQHLHAQGDHQIVMLGYSDSTKDGGYLSACWSLHQAQKQLSAIAACHGVHLVYFHGRGGSLGRGGGPTARSILSLPGGTFRGAFRLTEQGEVLADRYDDAAIANRHLEQVLWSSLLAAGRPAPPDHPGWFAMMEQLSERSFLTYRNLVEQPDFVEFFRRATPISEIEQLPIGSRPARRKSSGSLKDLRAIPWVFSWTQSRCLIPAWYGLGSAMAEAIQDESLRHELQSMYREWTFFRALIDNAELALAKTDLQVAQHYSNLAADKPSLKKIADLINQEYLESYRAVLVLTGQKELLDGTPWLKESIRVRNRFIDPLNLIQVELLRRRENEAATPEELENLRHLTRLSINGVAAGLRTSG